MPVLRLAPPTPDSKRVTVSLLCAVMRCQALYCIAWCSNALRSGALRREAKKPPVDHGGRRLATEVETKGTNRTIRLHHAGRATEYRESTLRNSAKVSTYLRFSGFSCGSADFRPYSTCNTVLRSGIIISMTNAVTYRRARNSVEVYCNGRYAACIEKDAFDRAGVYTVIVAIDRKTGAAAKISELTFEKLVTAKAYCKVWLTTGDPRLAIHKTLMRLPEYSKA